jgi:hypothetical protein
MISSFYFDISDDIFGSGIQFFNKFVVKDLFLFQVKDSQGVSIVPLN